MTRCQKSTFPRSAHLRPALSLRSASLDSKRSPIGARPNSWPSTASVPGPSVFSGKHLRLAVSRCVPERKRCRACPVRRLGAQTTRCPSSDIPARNGPARPRACRRQRTTRGPRRGPARPSATARAARHKCPWTCGLAALPRLPGTRKPSSLRRRVPTGGRRLRREDYVLLCSQQIRQWEQILESGQCVRARRSKNDNEQTGHHVRRAMSSLRQKTRSAGM